MQQKHRGRRGRVLFRALVAGAVVVVTGVTIYAVVDTGGPAPGNGALSADLAKATITTFDITTTATGDLQAKNQIEVRSELDTDSTIVELVPEGTMVKAGDLLVRLNGDPIETQINDESLRVESARADQIAADNSLEIQKSQNDSRLRQATLKLELAKLALEQWTMGEVVQRRQDLALALDNTEKELARLEEKFKRSQDLFDAGFLSKDELQRDEIALRKARADREKAILDEQTYSEYVYRKDEKSKISDVEEAIAELERVKQQNEIELASKEADKVNRRRQFQLREEKLKKLQTQLLACTMLAPSDGLVVYATSAGRNWGDDSPFQVGRRVMPREILIVLPDTSVMVAVVKVHESLAGRLRPGQPSNVKIDMLGGRVFTGKVESIGVMAETGDRWRDPNRREYSVRITLDNAPGVQDLRPSMRCEAAITLGSVATTLAVPLQAVFSEGQLRYVYVPGGNRFDRVPVRVGQRSDTYAEIKAGLSEGQRVLLRKPTPAEVSLDPWNKEQLKLVGFELDEDGKPTPLAGTSVEAEPETPSGPPLPTGANGGSQGGGNRPAGARPGGSGGQRPGGGGGQRSPRG